MILNESYFFYFYKGNVVHDIFILAMSRLFYTKALGSFRSVLFEQQQSVILKEETADHTLIALGRDF